MNEQYWPQKNDREEKSNQRHSIHQNRTAKTQNNYYLLLRLLR